jgi:hypothetical protein
MRESPAVPETMSTAVLQVNCNNIGALEESLMEKVSKHLSSLEMHNLLFAQVGSMWVSKGGWVHATMMLSEFIYFYL